MEVRYVVRHHIKSFFSFVTSSQYPTKSQKHVLLKNMLKASSNFAFNLRTDIKE